MMKFPSTLDEQRLHGDFCPSTVALTHRHIHQ
jgi:hypothetical protein